eukprot:SAG25_NODE_1020_length_4269_cov_4.759712_1_plen_774_part_00
MLETPEYVRMIDSEIKEVSQLAKQKNMFVHDTKHGKAMTSRDIARNVEYVLYVYDRGERFQYRLDVIAHGCRLLVYRPPHLQDRNRPGLTSFTGTIVWPDKAKKWRRNGTEDQKKFASEHEQEFDILAGHGLRNFEGLVEIVQRRHKEGLSGSLGDGLMTAASKGDVDLVKQLIDTAADVKGLVNHRGKNGCANPQGYDPLEGWTPLAASANSGTTACMDVLIANGADVNQSAAVRQSHNFAPGAETVADECTPLHIAAKHGHFSAVKCLIEANANVHALTQGFSSTALHLAAEKGHVDVAKHLLVAKCCIHAADVDWDTPLHLAAMENRREMVSMLIEAGADVHATTRCGWDTPLHRAAAGGATESAMLLIENQANLATPDKQKLTALHKAYIFNRIDTADKLIEAGANEEAQDEDGDTPKMLCRPQAPSGCKLVLFGCSICHYPADTWKVLSKIPGLFNQGSHLARVAKWQASGSMLAKRTFFAFFEKVAEHKVLLQKLREDKESFRNTLFHMLLFDGEEVRSIEKYPTSEDEPNWLLGYDRMDDQQLSRGTIVMIRGLIKEDSLNGQVGRVVKFLNARGRYRIGVKDRKIDLKPCHCELCEVVLTKRHPHITVSKSGFVATLAEGPEGPRRDASGNALPHLVYSEVVMSGGKHFAQFSILKGTLMCFGVIRPNVSTFGENGNCYYVTDTGKRWQCSQGQSSFDNWDRMQSACPLDRIALLLDQESGSITVFKNDERLGVMAEGLSGDYCWAILMNRKGSSVRIKSLPLPS